MKAFLYVSLAIIAILIILYFCFRKQIHFFIATFTDKKRIQRNLYKACKLNDYLIINDIYLPVNKDTFMKMDTIIFGNKYVYIVKEMECIGELKTSLKDNSWRLIYKSKLTLIDNPFIENKKVIENLVRVVNNLEFNDLKSIVIIPENCLFNAIEENSSNYIVSENEVIKTIQKIENNSNDDILDPIELEKLCNAFYQEGLKAEKTLAKYKKRGD